MKVYISGRITGNEKYFERDFKWMYDQLSRLPDIEAINPLTFDYPSEAEWSDFIKIDIDELKECDAIVMIEGIFPLHRGSNWRKSPGAKIERIVAKKYGLKIFYGWPHFRKWYLKRHKYDGVNNGK